MTQEVLASQPTSEAATSVSPGGVGATLRQLRQAQNISVEQACRRLKFSRSQLEALEDEAWDKLSKGTPLRGFVRNYARYLDADVDALLAQLDQQVEPPPTAFVDSSQQAPFAPADLHDHEDLPGRSWGWLLVILLFVVVVGYYAISSGWIPDSWLIFDWLKALK